MIKVQKMKKNKLLLPILLLTLFVPLNSFSVVEDVKSKITDVTLYMDRAVVTRTMSMTVQAGQEGDMEFNFTKLPLNIDAQSIRATASGRGKVSDIKIDKHFVDKLKNPKVKELDEKIKIVRAELGAIDYKKRNLWKQKDLIDKSFVLKNVSDTQREIKEGRVDALEWQKLTDFYLANLNTIDKKLASLNPERDKLQVKLTDLKRELSKYQTSRVEGSTSVSVLVENITGKVDIKLSYMVFNASWRPAYDVRALQDGAVELTYYGKIRQATEEDWNGVNLKLSTAKPSFSATPPKLTPWILDIVTPYKQKGLMKRSLSESVMMMDVADGDFEEGFAMGKGEAKAFAPVSTNITSTEFNVKRRATLLSNNEEERVTILKETLSSELAYVTVPKLNKYAFLEAAINNTLEYPILAGASSVYINDSFVGTAYLEEKLPGEELVMPLGIDESIKVERKLIKKEKAKKGITKSKERILYTFNIEVQNLKSKAAEITVLDQLPISRNKDIVVKLVKIDMEYDKIDENGIMEWLKTLAPNDKFSVTYSFYIEYPKGTIITGIF